MTHSGGIFYYKYKYFAWKIRQVKLPQKSVCHTCNSIPGSAFHSTRT